MQVSLLLPECGSAPSHLDAVLNGFSSFYLIRDLPIHELLDKDFLQSAVYQGNTCTHARTRALLGHLFLVILQFMSARLSLRGRVRPVSRDQDR